VGARKVQATMGESESSEAVLVAAVRTPIAKFLGAYKDVPAVDLGAAAIRRAVETAGLAPGDVEYVIMGQVVQAGGGQNPARQAAARAGLPMTTPAVTVNKVCLASLNAIALAAQMVRYGEAEVVVAGGMESMSRAPYLADEVRAGHRLGPLTLRDSLIVDGLWCAFDDVVMGESAEGVHAREGITRQEQDAWAAESQRRAAAATAARHFAAELVEVAAARTTSVLTADECIRAETTLERLSALKPAFRPDGTITAGNSSSLSDGAAAVIVMSGRRARAGGHAVLAEIAGHSMVAGPDPSLHVQPVNAVRRLLDTTGLTRNDIALFEINEAFAGVALYAARQLGLDHDLVNVHGGAVALGHPLGCTGARLVVTLVHALRRRGGGLGVATLCGGGGQGEALLLRVA